MSRFDEQRQEIVALIHQTPEHDEAGLERLAARLTQAGLSREGVASITKLARRGQGDRAVALLDVMRPGFRMGGLLITAVTVLPLVAVIAFTWEELVGKLSQGLMSWLPGVVIGVTLAVGASLWSIPRVARPVLWIGVGLSVVFLVLAAGLVITGAASQALGPGLAGATGVIAGVIVVRVV